MKTRHKIITVAVMFGVFIWVFDVIMRVFFFYEGGFWQLLIMDTPKHEIYIRLLTFACFLLFGILMARIVEKRKQIEKALRESENRYKMVSELMSDYVFRISIEADGKIAMNFVTDSFYSITGRTLADAKTPDLWTKIFHPEDLGGAMKFLQTLVSSGQSGELECRTYVKGDVLRWVHIFARSEWDEEQQRTVAIIGAVKDITERKRAEAEIHRLNAELEQRVQQRTAELEAANKELKDFAYVVSHDLKTPLRGISQLAQWLVQDYAQAFDAEGQKLVTMLLTRVKRLDALINGLLEYSRVGRIVGKDAEINLNQLVGEVVALLAPPDTIRVVIENDLPTVIGDKIRIIQVFQNLVENAIKFMDKPQGEVKVGCVDAGTSWKFSIADNGPGIDPKYHGKIFQIFQTLTSHDEREDVGIGLALVKKIVEFYGGKIWVESVVGQGSMFFFTLPKK